MNVYDFDDTIIAGDSTKAFYLFCLKRHPRLGLYVIPVVCAGLGYALRLVKLEFFKERFYRSFVPRINLEAEIAEFWEMRRAFLKPWYLQQKKDSDLIISASPTFLLKPICAELKVNLLASEVDTTTGRLLGSNCKGAEKVRVFRALYPEATIEEFYSDSLSDSPLAALAKRSYLVKGDVLSPWPSLVR